MYFLENKEGRKMASRSLCNSYKWSKSSGRTWGTKKGFLKTMDLLVNGKCNYRKLSVENMFVVEVGETVRRIPLVEFLAQNK